MLDGSWIFARTDLLRVLRFLQSCSEILTCWISNAAATPEARQQRGGSRCYGSTVRVGVDRSCESN